MVGAARRTYRMEARAEDVADTRERILTAARERFLARSFDDVTLNDIADDAEVTRQTVLNHFESKDGVFLAAAGTVVQQRDLAAPGDTEAALDALFAEYEDHGDALWRLIEVEERFEAVRTQLERGRNGHRAWVEAIFGSRLPGDSGSDDDPPPGQNGPGDDVRRRTLVLALVAATDLSTWKLLRRDLGVDAAEARAVIGRLVAGALADPRTDTAGEGT